MRTRTRSGCTAPPLSVHVTGATGATLQVIAGGVTIAAAPITTADWRLETPLPPGAAYARAQVIDPYGNVLALSNALWVEDDTGSSPPPLPQS